MMPLRRVHVLMATVLCAGALAAAQPAVAAAGPTSASSRHESGNLVVNPRARVGATSAQGWDAVTIPGWRVAAGLPTVVRYGTRGFPRAARSWPAARGRLFAGGAGGTASLVQRASLRLASGRPAPRGTRYRLSAWLGGTATSWAEVRVRFLSASGRLLAQRVIGPVGRTRRGHATLARRASTGTLPAGTASAQVRLVLATSLRDVNGPYAPVTGYNRAVAGDLSLTVSAPVRAPRPPAPPTARVPRFQHVFLFYFENQDYHAVIGNTKQAPYLNRLLPHASLLSQFYAEEHPSDGNYLALAGGSTFGVPLTDPEEENPLYTIRARNIGDLIDAAHETWKTYLQSAAGPCDDTVHTYYWNDDQPMMYFADVRDRPGLLRAPRRAAGVAAGRPGQGVDDAELRLGGPERLHRHGGLRDQGGRRLPGPRAERRSCARRPGGRSARWPSSRSTRTPRTASARPSGRRRSSWARPGVRQGFVTRKRYTHYSLLRTIEAALGLGTLTANDRYAQPVNGVFARSASLSQPGPDRAGRDRRQASASPPRPGSPSRGRGPPR